jgi:hypothetical protein
MDNGPSILSAPLDTGRSTNLPSAPPSGARSNTLDAIQPSHSSIRAAPSALRHRVQAKLAGGTATRGRDQRRSSMSAQWHGAHRSMCTLTVRAFEPPPSSSTPFGATSFTRRSAPLIWCPTCPPSHAVSTQSLPPRTAPPSTL